MRNAYTPNFHIMHERVKQNSSVTLAYHYLSIILHAKQKNLSPKTFSCLSAIPRKYDNGLLCVISIFEHSNGV